MVQKQGAEKIWQDKSEQYVRGRWDRIKLCYHRGETGTQADSVQRLFIEVEIFEKLH